MKEHLNKIKEELATKQCQLLDVREEDEWEEGHLVSAKLVPLSELMQGTFEDDNFDKNKKTYLHCRSGNRVLEASPLLANLGFTDVVPLQEGYNELVREGF